MSTNDCTSVACADEINHWRVKAECYGRMVHNCAPALAEAGFPVDSSQPGGGVEGVRKAVIALAADRDGLREEVEQLKRIGCYGDGSSPSPKYALDRLAEKIADLGVDLRAAEAQRDRLAHAVFAFRASIDEHPMKVLGYQTGLWKDVVDAHEAIMTSRQKGDA